MAFFIDQPRILWNNAPYMVYDNFIECLDSNGQIVERLRYHEWEGWKELMKPLTFTEPLKIDGRRYFNTPFYIMTTQASNSCTVSIQVVTA